MNNCWPIYQWSISNDSDLQKNCYVIHQILTCEYCSVNEDWTCNFREHSHDEERNEFQKRYLIFTTCINCPVNKEFHFEMKMGEGVTGNMHKPIMMFLCLSVQIIHELVIKTYKSTISSTVSFPRSLFSSNSSFPVGSSLSNGPYPFDPDFGSILDDDLIVFYKTVH